MTILPAERGCHDNDNPPEVIRVSYSSLGTFSSCARKFEFDKLYPRIRRAYEDNYAADVGSALHKGYQEFLIRGDEDTAIWEFMQAFPFEAEYSQTNDYRSFEAALSTLEEMMHTIKMEEYRLAQIRHPNGEIVPAIEVPFEIRFKGLHIAPCERYPNGAEFSIIGYIDAIMQHVVTDMYRTLDIKTSRMNLADPTGKYKFDTQQVPYGIVVDHVAQGVVDAFEVLYLDCYIDILEPRVKPLAFMKTRRDIEEWGLNKVIQFQQIARFAGADYFPRTENGCLFYNKPCRYLEPCQSRDRDTLTEWFTMGSNDLVVDDFEPWIVADLDVGG